MTVPHFFRASLVTFGLVLVACSTSATEVRPFSEVQASEFSFENDPSVPGRGIFRVVTTEPMICAVVWGETEALGRMNNTIGMDGTGIVDHNVLLPGAEPEATYYYRVQGTTADGTFYQSDLATFTLPAATEADDASATYGANVAEGAAVVEVSSEFSEAWAAGNAVDGDLGTEWSSAGDGNGAFIAIDLGSVREIAAVEFLTRSMPDGSATADMFSVVVDDATSFGPFAAGRPAQREVNPVDFTGRVLRFEIEASSGGNTGAIEVRVFAP